MFAHNRLEDRVAYVAGGAARQTKAHVTLEGEFEVLPDERRLGRLPWNAPIAATTRPLPSRSCSHMALCAC